MYNMRGSASSLISSNRLLACLPRKDHQKLAPELELISLKARHSAYEAGKAIEHIYFPLNSVISISVGTRQGTDVEVATIGNEGMVGLPIFSAQAAHQGALTPKYRATASESRRRPFGNKRGNQILLLRSCVYTHTR